MNELSVYADTSAELVDRLRAAHQALAVAQAERIRLETMLYRRRRCQELELRVNPAFAGQSTATEVGVILKSSQRQADRDIAIGLALEHALPCTRKMFGDGRIDLPKVQIICAELQNVAPELLAVLEPRIAAYAETVDPSRLKRTIRRWVLEADPAGEVKRRKQAEHDRYVQVTAHDNGTALVDAVLPAAGGQTLYERLREMANTQCCTNDPRTSGQRRADALVALADGSARLTCQCGRRACPHADITADEPRRPLIQVGVSAETLAGLQDNPALLAGFGAVDADLARQIARHARYQVFPEPEATSLNQPTTVIAPPGSNSTTTDRPGGHADAARRADENGPAAATAEPGSGSRTTDRPGGCADAARRVGENGPAAVIVEPGSGCRTTDRPGGCADAARRVGENGPAAVIAEPGSSCRTTDRPGGYADTARRADEVVIASGTDIGATQRPRNDAGADRSGTAAVDHRQRSSGHTTYVGWQGGHRTHTIDADSSHGYEHHTPSTHADSSRGYEHRMQGSHAESQHGDDHQSLAVPGAEQVRAKPGQFVRPPDPGTGKTESRYRPGARLAALVRAVDGGCRAPGCGTPAVATDLDHHVPFNHADPARGGRTTEANLSCCCRRHHRLKTLADNDANGWRTRQYPGRRQEWLTPTGESVITEPEGADYLFPREPVAPAGVIDVPVPGRYARSPIDGSDIESGLRDWVHAHVPPGRRRRPRRVPEVFVANSDLPPPF
ncbi:uncharacterized protein DUF222 [Nocardia mexicana]|uniref:Uncharacterized protein DUF222 n=2 Tax=Nocardia mexicana TaxID=279262 RepID=A0A370H7Z8_9NOCA|nr:uncharacterized protein DUF222 [Nocardia mexicana]